jgi:pilus assembly protein CpaE
LEHPARVDDLFLDRAAIHATQRLSLLASLESTDALLVPEEQAVLSLLEKLMRRYRYVIVDVPVDIARRLPRMLRLPGICLLVSNASLASARDVARWRESLGPNAPERQTLHILNKSGARGSLPMAEFIRAAGQTPEITVPYDAAIGLASNMGVREVCKSAPLQRGLAPLFSLVVGEAPPPPSSSLRRRITRLLGRT